MHLLALMGRVRHSAAAERPSSRVASQNLDRIPGVLHYKPPNRRHRYEAARQTRSHRLRQEELVSAILRSYLISLPPPHSFPGRRDGAAGRAKGRAHKACAQGFEVGDLQIQRDTVCPAPLWTGRALPDALSAPDRLQGKSLLRPVVDEAGSEATNKKTATVLASSVRAAVSHPKQFQAF